MYGDVTYDRHVYQSADEEGHRIFVYLLDEAVKMDKIGLISTKLAEKIASCVTENPYRVTAEIISGTSGQKISHGDVWLRLQGKDHKSVPKQEMKVAIYEGWEKDDRTGNRLCSKRVIAGMEKSSEFYEKREDRIRSIYNTDEIEYRILNGDGGSWIKDLYEPETVFQLDRFHIRQEIERKLNHDKEAARAIKKLFEAEKMDEMLEYIQIHGTTWKQMRKGYPVPEDP